MNDSIPDGVNGGAMGVKLSTWLKRDPKQPLTSKGDDDDFSLDLFWERNFYPDFGTIVNDLHKKGLIDEGKYMIEIDW